LVPAGEAERRSENALVGFTAVFAAALRLSRLTIAAFFRRDFPA